MELYVEATDPGLELVPGPLSDPALMSLLAAADLDPSEGQRLEVSPAAVDFVRSCAAAVETGSVVLVDYGLTWRGLADRPAGTLVSYSDAGADDLVLDRPGEKDITSHANWDVVASTLRSEGFEVSGPTPQREVLNDLGLPDLEESLAAEAAGPGLGGTWVPRPCRALSRRQALGVLSDPNGLGGLEVLTGRRDV